MRLIISLSLLAVCLSVSFAQFCTNFGEGGSNFPGPIPVFPTKYQTKVELKNDQNKKMTEMRLYYDYYGQKAAAEIVRDMQYTRYIFNYATNEIFELNHEVGFPSNILAFPPDERPEFPTTCTTHTLTEKIELAHMFGFVQLSNQLFPGNPQEAFRFAPQEYNGQIEIRGIQSDSYMSCMYDPVEKSNYTVVHYFSRNGTFMPGSDGVTNQFLVRAVFNGVTKDEMGNLIPFTNIYDYFEFSTDVNRNAFKTPSSVFCPNRKATKQAPKIEKNFGFNLEISTSAIQQIKDFYQLGPWTYYEMRNYVVQESTFFSTNPIIYITDNSYGVQYAIDKNIGNCTIRPFKSVDYDNVLPEKYDNALALIARIQATQKFLDPNQNYIYTGDRVANGIPSYRFMANISSDIYEYTFSDDEFFVTSESSIEQNVPVTLYLDSPKQGHSSHSTFYNYVKRKSPDTRRFEMIGSCFKQSEKLTIDLIFPYTGIVTADEIRSQTDINTLLLAELYEVTGLSDNDIRFRKPVISAANDGNLYARFEILPPPPPLAAFTKIESAYLTVPSLNSQILETVEQCAQFCLSNPKCLSFDYSETNYCHLNDRVITDGTSTSEGPYFDHYTRNAVTNLPVYKTNVEILNLLKENVTNGGVSLDIFLNRSQQIEAVQLKAKEVKQINVAFGRFGSTTLLRRFKNVLPNSKLNKVTNIQLTGVTIDQCAQKCSEELGAPCSSFEFCYLLGTCQLSENFAPSPNQTDLYSPDENCDIYNKNALAHYNFFPSKAKINKNDLKYTPVSSVEECASKCDREKSIHCRSFNFCPGEKLCYLSQTHSVDITSGETTDLVCDHFSRRYIEDFVYIGTADTTVDGEIMLTDVDLDLCSLTCVTAAGFDCKTIDYCEDSKTCLINSGDVAKPQSAIDRPPIEKCAHYRREYFPDTSRLVNLGKGDDDSSESLLLGLSLSFGIVAVIVGLFGTVHFFKKRVLKTT